MFFIWSNMVLFSFLTSDVHSKLNLGVGKTDSFPYPQIINVASHMFFKCLHSNVIYNVNYIAIYNVIIIDICFPWAFMKFRFI